MTHNHNFLNNPAKKSRGFSLVEVMVALAVFSIIALALASQVSHTTLTNVSARQVTSTSVLASEQIENLIPLPYESSLIADGNHTDTTNETIAHEPTYFIRYETRRDDTLPRTTTVRVTVTYIEKGGVTRSTSFNYLLPEII